MKPAYKSFEDLLNKNRIYSINFGYASFYIKFIDGLNEEGETCWGVTEFDKYEIKLERTIPIYLGREVLMHEITHVVLNLVGFGGYRRDKQGNDSPDGYIPETTNEFLTEAITMGMTQAMRLNRDLFKVLING